MTVVVILRSTGGVSDERTAWHFYFELLIKRRGPRWLEVISEHRVAKESQRADFLLLRRRRVGVAPRDSGEVLRRVWAHLRKDMLLEFKSPERPFRGRDLHRLLGYAFQHYVGQARRLKKHADLALLLVVPSRTKTLKAAAHELGYKWKNLGGGYWQLAGSPFELYVAEVRAVADHEEDDLLRLFSGDPVRTMEAQNWWLQQDGAMKNKVPVDKLPDYENVVRKFMASVPIELRLKGIPVELRLKDVPVAERLKDVPAEERVLTLPDEALRALSQEYLATLPAHVREAVRTRIGA